MEEGRERGGREGGKMVEGERERGRRESSGFILCFVFRAVTMATHPIPVSLVRAVP